MKELRRQTQLPRFGQPRRRGRARRDPLPPSLRPRALRAEPVATGRWSFPRRHGAWPWGLLGSILAHLGLLALLLWPGQGGRINEAALPPPAVDIVFESGQPEPQATGAPEGEEPAAVEPPAPAESPPPAPEAPPTPTQPPAPPTPPEPPRLAEPPPPPSPAQPAPPRTAAAPPPPSPPLAPLPQPPAIQAPPPQPALADLPPRPIEPLPRLSAEIPPVETPPDLLAPQTPLALNQPRIQPTPRPEPRPRPPQQQAQSSPRLPGLYLPEGPSFSTPRPTPGRPLSPRAPLDLAVGPRFLDGRMTPDPSVQVRGAQVGPNWNAAFRRWLDQNLHYPIRAIEEGDSGTVRVRIMARPDGTVTGVRLMGASASPWLNSGTTRPFPGATLPAFPPGADPNGVEVDLTVNYVLIRR